MRQVDSAVVQQGAGQVVLEGGWRWLEVLTKPFARNSTRHLNPLNYATVQLAHSSLHLTQTNGDPIWNFGCQCTNYPLDAGINIHGGARHLRLNGKKTWNPRQIIYF